MATDHELITRTVPDYFEGWYDADVARMDRALPPDLVERSPAEEDGAIVTEEVIIERLGGIETGHRELLDRIDQWISR